ncbi:MAG: UDP-N-acetyl-D-glucosamine dehydrogenase, partial [Gemmatimonadetes bacterium]|nr:UDP-N-acetyl-D-glucosamine dehydrogenase [Gemmatimonadota bacterium]
MERFADHTAVVAVMGLGYVGLPLAVAFARAGFRVLGFDISPDVIRAVREGRSHVADVASPILAALVGEGLLTATDDDCALAQADAISICVPTPLSKTRDPDVSYVVAATEAVARTLRRG